ncbi:metallophosphoesterase [Muribaculum sp. NM65_B17]|nr:metallophosphoesterase [uncultured Muribaculum sp.]TGY03303.1 metallophosphoesterase [Muribaculum sp. NM65_B17]THG42705.1 metallophosphoesterase [Muribaculaceae bacterium]
MRLPILTMIILIVVNVFVDIYIWRCIVNKERKRWPGVVYAWSSLFFIIFIIVTVALPRRSGSDAVLLAVMWMLYTYLSVYISKYVFCIISFIGLIPRLWRGKRWKAMNIIGSVAAVAVFLTMWWGALINRTRYQIKEVVIEFADLPDAFDGYRVLQFSDFHVGTYGSDTTFVSEIVDVINNQSADLVLFTGDIVNRRTDELLPQVKPLSRLKAADGVYSILGNHDYGDYKKWPSAEMKSENMDMMYRLQRDMGWNLMNNRSEYIRRGNDSIALIGVENWGDPPFTVYGDLDKAYPMQSDSTFKILMTHNPAHWSEKIADNDTVNIALSLSGHTHAMQCQIGSWSPAEWRYDNWGGLYDDLSSRHKLYVNIGLGTVALPARIGATPEITVLTLRKAH